MFASGLLRSGTVEVRYEVDNPGDENPALGDDQASVRFSEEVGTGATFGVGARLQLLVLNLVGQYTFEDYSVLTLKIGFGTR